MHEEGTKESSLIFLSRNKKICVFPHQQPSEDSIKNEFQADAVSTEGHRRPRSHQRSSSPSEDLRMGGGGEGGRGVTGGVVGGGGGRLVIHARRLRAVRVEPSRDAHSHVQHLHVLRHDLLLLLRTSSRKSSADGRRSREKGKVV
ncbi:unnamed protein product [Musa hybrid cultivar]